MTTNTDHFTPVSKQYVAFRPSYPDALFDWLASIAPGRKLAWDCGAGSGQATVGLSLHFEHVMATDISTAQLAAAPKLANVEFRVAPDEASGLPDQSVDIVTVAQALHWFDLPKFYAEVNRVLKPRGIIAAWGYNRLQIDHPGLQLVLDRFYDETVGTYWPPERIHVENGYRDLPFPYSRMTSPPFALHQEWSREHLLGYLRSWSAVARYQAKNGVDPVSELADEISAYWQEGKVHLISWPLFMHVGQIE